MFCFLLIRGLSLPLLQTTYSSSLRIAWEEPKGWLFRRFGEASDWLEIRIDIDMQ
jgi:hypothetical protein